MSSESPDPPDHAGLLSATAVSYHEKFSQATRLFRAAAKPLEKEDGFDFSKPPFH